MELELKELTKVLTNINILCDNHRAFSLAENPIIYTKHFDIRHHFIQAKKNYV